MARGKHAASAAKRRAESAEDQLDRLLPQLVDAKRIANQYKAEAERVPVLCRQLRELKETMGMPVAEHEAQVRAIEEDCRLTMEVYEAAARVMALMFVHAMEDIPVAKRPTVATPVLVEALQVFPPDISDKVMGALGYDRGDRRWLRRDQAPTAMRDHQEDQFLALTRYDPLGMTLEEKRWMLEGVEGYTGRSIYKASAVLHPRGRRKDETNGDEPEADE